MLKLKMNKYSKRKWSALGIRWYIKHFWRRFVYFFIDLEV